MALHLTDIAMIWWQPNLITQLEPLICNNWSEFVEQLNVLFGPPDLTQASEHTLCALKMQGYHAHHLKAIRLRDGDALSGIVRAALWDIKVNTYTHNISGAGH